MASASSASRTSAYKPALAVFAAFGGAWVFVLVTLGAFTTSIGAGMAFPDWPLSNGSINPEGWLRDELQRMADGMSGHLDEWYPEVCGDRNAWLGGDGGCRR